MASSAPAVAAAGRGLPARIVVAQPPKNASIGSRIANATPMYSHWVVTSSLKNG